MFPFESKMHKVPVPSLTACLKQNSGPIKLSFGAAPAGIFRFRLLRAEASGSGSTDQQALDSQLASFACPNTNRFLNRNNEHFAVPNPPGSRFIYNGLNRAGTIVGNHNFKFKFREEIRVVRSRPRNLCHQFAKRIDTRRDCDTEISTGT
jgi:hypothetical protein